MDDITLVVPDKVDTLREDANCPECSTPMDKNDPICEMCGYEKPPDEFDDPDLDAAKRFDEKQRREKDQGQGGTEAPQEDEPKRNRQRPRRGIDRPKRPSFAMVYHPSIGVTIARNSQETPSEIIERLVKAGHPEVPGMKFARYNGGDVVSGLHDMTFWSNQVESLGLPQRKSINQGDNRQMEATITLEANAKVPSPEKLASLGWDVVKTAGPDPKDRNEKTLAEDGRKATNEPSKGKVIADQTKPVESKKQADRVIRREEIIESDEEKEKDEEAHEEQNPTRQNLTQPSWQAATKTAEKDEDSEEEVEEDKSDEDEPEAEVEEAEAETRRVEVPVEVEVPVLRASSERTLFAALELAELEQEVGLDSNWTVDSKMARVGELEDEKLEIIQAKVAALRNVKEAGLLKPRVARVSGKMPSFKAVKAASVTPDQGEAVPDGFSDELLFA